MSHHDNRPLRSAFGRLVVRAFDRWQRRRATNQLQALDDRELGSIGLFRNEIPRAVDDLFPEK